MWWEERNNEKTSFLLSGALWALRQEDCKNHCSTRQDVTDMTGEATTNCCRSPEKGRRMAAWRGWHLTCEYMQRRHGLAFRAEERECHQMPWEVRDGLGQSGHERQLWEAKLPKPAGVGVWGARRQLRIGQERVLCGLGWRQRWRQPLILVFGFDSLWSGRRP